MARKSISEKDSGGVDIEPKREEEGPHPESG